MNKHRGEVTFSLCDREFTVRPTFQVLASVEGVLGVSLFEYTLQLSRGQASLVSVVSALREIVKNEPKAPTKNQIGDWLLENGLHLGIIALGNFLVSAIKGPGEPMETDDPGET